MLTLLLRHPPESSSLSPSAFNQRANLLVNGGFEIWQRGTSFAAMADGAFGPDRWQFGKGGTSALTVTQETSVVDTASRYSAKLAYTHNVGSAFYQWIEDYYQLRGLTVTLSMRVRSNTASAVQLRVDDSTGTGTTSGFHTGDSTWQTLTATKVISGSATYVTIVVELEASATIYIDSAMLVLGTQVAAYSPLTPAEDLARCLRYYEVFGGTDLFEALGVGLAVSTTSVLAVKDFTQKAVVPTVTFAAAAGQYAVDDGAGATVACTAISGTRVGRNSCQISATVAAGLTAGRGARVVSNNNTAAILTFEANP